MRKAIGLALLLSGCATSTTWYRADGQPVTPTQLQLDQTACQGELQKTDIVGRRNTGLAGALGYDPAGSRVYEGCMAEHGYLAQR